jgi:hypothetical protein
MSAIHKLTGTGDPAAAARQERGEWEDFFATAGPQLEAEAHRRHAAEAAVGAKAEREQRDYEKSLDDELDAEARLLEEQDREEREEREESDPRKIFARAERRQREQKEVERLAATHGPAKIPSYYIIRRQDLAIRRRQRAEAAHAKAEARAGIPVKAKAWTRKREKITTEAEKALTGEDERHFHDRQSIIEQRDRDLKALGECPTLPKPPIRVPRVDVADGQERAKMRERLGETVRELEGVAGPKAVEPAKRQHPEIAKARAKARRLGRLGR